MHSDECYLSIFTVYLIERHDLILYTIAFSLEYNIVKDENDQYKKKFNQMSTHLVLSSSAIYLFAKILITFSQFLSHCKQQKSCSKDKTF